jgi:hypothetical protein
LLCLATAAAFWVLNAMGGQYETNISYPVHFVPDSISSSSSIVKTEIVLNVKGSGWELLKRNLAFKFNPLELPISLTKGKGVVPIKKIKTFVGPHLGKLELKGFVADSVFLESKKVVQKKVYLRVDSSKFKIKEPYRISGKVYLEPDYITISGLSAAVLKVPDTLSLLQGARLYKSVDTLVRLSDELPKDVKSDYYKAHLIFELAPFFKKERQVQATLIGFPADAKERISIPVFTIKYFVEEDNILVESKAKYKVLLDYNMRDSIAKTLVPVLVDFPDYIRDYTVSPALLHLKNGR